MKKCSRQIIFVIDVIFVIIVITLFIIVCVGLTVDGNYTDKSYIENNQSKYITFISTNVTSEFHGFCAEGDDTCRRVFYWKEDKEIKKLHQKSLTFKVSDIALVVIDKNTSSIKITTQNGTTHKISSHTKQIFEENKSTLRHLQII